MPKACYFTGNEGRLCLIMYTCKYLAFDINYFDHYLIQEKYLKGKV